MLFRILKLVFKDIFKNKVIVMYAVFLALASWSSFLLEDSPSKGVLTLLNIVLLIVPLVSSLFSTIYIFNSAEFVELLLSQPLKRSLIWISLFAGLSLSFALAFFLGAGIPALMFAEGYSGWVLLGTGLFVSQAFISLAFLTAVYTRDKARGIGAAIMLWVFFAFLFDALILFVLFQFSDYPLERFMIAASCLSPINLSRILILLQLDISALMGYTGALFREFLGSSSGMLLSVGMLLLWILIPFGFSLRKFRSKDL